MTIIVVYITTHSIFLIKMDATFNMQKMWMWSPWDLVFVETMSHAEKWDFHTIYLCLCDYWSMSAGLPVELGRRENTWKYREKRVGSLT